MSMQVCEQFRLGVETVTHRRKRQQGRSRERLLADILESHADSTAALPHGVSIHLIWITVSVHTKAGG